MTAKAIACTLWWHLLDSGHGTVAAIGLAAVTYALSLFLWWVELSFLFNFEHLPENWKSKYMHGNFCGSENCALVHNYLIYMAWNLSKSAEDFRHGTKDTYNY